MKAIAPTLLALVVSCGGADGELVCPHTGLDDTPDNCFAALIFANRDTSELIATQAEVDRYFDRWQRTVIAEPVLFRRTPQPHRAFGFREETHVEVITENLMLINAWRAGIGVEDSVPLTGDASFDAIMAELVNPHQPRFVDLDGDGIGELYFDTDTRFNEEVLNARLAASNARLPDPIVAPHDEGTWKWQGTPTGSSTDDDTAVIEFTFGWGDCATGCRFFHSVRAVVPASGPPEVFDLGGDPLEPGLELSPNTKPPP